jgi:hypothetical protein
MIKYGSTVTLECSLKGSYNDYEMLWFKVQSNGKYLEQKSTSRSTWSSDYNNRVQREVLRISNFIEENEEYFCQVRRYGVKYIRKTDHVKLRLESKWYSIEVFTFGYMTNVIVCIFEWGSLNYRIL